MTCRLLEPAEAHCFFCRCPIVRTSDDQTPGLRTWRCAGCRRRYSDRFPDLAESAKRRARKQRKEQTT